MTASPSTPTGSSSESRRSWASTYRTNPYRELPWFQRGPSREIVYGRRAGVLRPRTRHLDVGCGAGSNVLWLASQGLQATGVDLAPGAAAAGRGRALRSPSSRRRAAFVAGDALALPFSERAFDSASDIGCFHTLPPARRRDYARELHRVLRPGGTLVLSWVAREDTRELGPPHRPSVQEVASSLEERFLFRGLEYHVPSGRWKGLKTYAAWLERRRVPQPPPR